MSEPILKVEHFNVDFWVDGVWYPAAIDMNFKLEPGRVLAIVGESGSGKSTTALGLMDLLASNARMSGSVKVKMLRCLVHLKQLCVVIAVKRLLISSKSR